MKLAFNARSIKITILASILSVIAVPAFGQSVSGLSFLTQSIIGGETVIGRVTLSGKAPAGGVVVTLTDASSGLLLPATVTVAPSQRFADFFVKSQVLPVSEVDVITATLGASSATASVTLLDDSIATFVLASPTISGGQQTTGTITMNGPAPYTGWQIHLKSTSGGPVEFSHFVYIMPGQTSVTFTLSAKVAKALYTELITASDKGSSASVTLTVTH